MTLLESANILLSKGKTVVLGTMSAKTLKPSDRTLRQRSQRRSARPFSRFLTLMLSVGLVLGAYKVIRCYFTTPQALLVLGGEPKREQFAAVFAREHPNLPIWVSGGSPKEYADWVFEEAGIDPNRIHLDYQAVDTVTNFTTLVNDLKRHNVKSVYLITSDDHMRRARMVGEIILGSQGIDIRPVSFKSGRHPEPTGKVVRDMARSVLWVTTGETGMDWMQSLQQHLPGSKEKS